MSRFGSASSASRPTPSPTARRGDLTTLLQGAIWGMPTTLYRPATDLSAPATALGQAAATVERVRRR